MARLQKYEPESLLRWDPFREVDLPMRNLMRWFLGPTMRRREVMGGEEGVYTDIFETKDAVVLKADLPGLDAKELKIDVSDNTLTLQGSREEHLDVPEEEYYRCERLHGSFTRSFTIPGNVDTGKIKAKMENGVLTVTLPKREEAKPKSITVEAKA